MLMEVWCVNFAWHKIDNRREWMDQLLKYESIEELKASAKKGVFLCPYCHIGMNVRAGKSNVEHFYHPKGLACQKSLQVESAYQNYQRQIKRESPKQQVLVSLVKDELET